MSKALQRKLQRTEASRQKLIEAHRLALEALHEAHAWLIEIAEYGDMIGSCLLCEQDIDGTGLKQAHLPECPFFWAAEALKARR